MRKFYVVSMEYACCCCRMQDSRASNMAGCVDMCCAAPREDGLLIEMPFARE